MLRIAEIAFWMMDAWPHRKARLLEPASHMNTSGIMDSRYIATISLTASIVPGELMAT